MPKKHWRLTRYLFKEQLPYLGWAILIVIAAETLLPLLLALLTGRLSTFSWRSHLSGLGIGFIVGLFIFIIHLQTYDNFKLVIQNGISRRTYWLARFYNLLVMSFIGTIFTLINDFAIAAPAMRIDVFAQLARGPYEMYTKFFGDNVFMTVTIYLLFLWLFFITVGAFAMVLSNIMNLFTKTVQRVIAIVVPILAVFALGFVGSIAVGRQTSAAVIAFTNFLKLLLGYHQTLGLFNPYMPMLTMMVSSSLFLAIAYYFNRKLQLRN
ncbi:ABC transporter permease [Lactiplantibacillus sp. WILCCON 0030]|uniref:ABC transporter permease n=1 Tax=Lactiplantibacillus brownii TaxID=3069269 RepID=A0ABU1AB05_9LACO|nr:ABC transporter permease [Lactiplantibacillus brownii]MDQ7938068.1 ABC transporter permease [Lactiplantibacillus brownii]